MIIGIFDFYELNNIEVASPPENVFDNGDVVIFKSEEGYEELGKILYISAGEKIGENFKVNAKILRKATAHDLQKFESNKERGLAAVEACGELVKKHLLDMQPFYGIYSLDGLRVNIIFTAEDRVDFRELVKDLAKNLQKQIHLKQIGPRDKARIVDGHGRCGRKFCCRGFLSKLESINMDMVRVQGLEGKGSAKLSGACGKLLCCLKYEVDAYKELKKELPLIGSKVRLKKPVFGSHDEGVVVSLDVLNRKFKIHVGERDYATASVDDISKILSKPIETAPKTYVVPAGSAGGSGRRAKSEGGRADGGESGGIGGLGGANSEERDAGLAGDLTEGSADSVGSDDSAGSDETSGNEDLT